MGHNHGKPITRRDFLGRGLLPFSAQLIMPSWVKFLGFQEQAAYAANCVSPDASLIPFIAVDLSGGASLHSNYIPLDKNNQMFSSYSQFAVGTVPSVVQEFGGLNFHAPKDANNIANPVGFLAGLRSTANVAVIAKTAFVAVCTTLQDDTSNNAIDISGMVAKAGRVGLQLPNLGRRSDTRTGGNHKSALVQAPSPLIVGSFTNISNALTYSSTLATSLNASQKSSLARLISNLTSSQTRKLASISNTSEVTDLINCAGIKNVNLVSGAGANVDPVLDSNTGIASVWNITGTSAKNSRDYVFGSMVYNTLNGNAGTATLEMGGYDYHGTPRVNPILNADGTVKTQSSNNRDFDAGMVIGRILQTASVMNKPVFIYVTSDGSASVDSTDPNADMTSDYGGLATVLYMIYFNPSGSGRPVTTGSQLGYLRLLNGRLGTDTTTIVGASPRAVAASVFANYLQVSGKVDQFNLVAGSNILSSTDVGKVLRFA